MEYYVKEIEQDSNTERVILHAAQKQSWKTWMDIYEVKETARSALFSIKAHDILALDYDVVDRDGN